MTTAAPPLARRASVASASVDGLRYRVELGDSPHCECPAFYFRSGGTDERGRRSCKHLRFAKSRDVLWPAQTGQERECLHCGAPVA